MAKKVLIPTKLDPVAREILESHGDYTVFQEEGADLISLAGDHSEAYALIVRSEKVTPEVIDSYPNLKVVVRAGAGFNTIDINYARSKGIDVMNTPGANSNAVAEEVLALMMAHARHLIPADRSCRAGKWEKSSFMGNEITGKTLGILGLGHIGQLLAKRASGFEMEVIAFDPIVSSDRASEIGVELVADHLDVFRRADYISLHIPENDHTRGMINEEVFAAMKEGAVLVNCARAGVIDEDALRSAKAEKKIGFLNDVYPKDAEGDKTVSDIADIMVPHLGASTKEANRNAAEFAANQLIALDEKGVGSAIVNRDIPVGLDPSYYELAYNLTKFNRQGFGPNAHLKMIQTFCYGDLAKFAEWLAVPIVCALDEGFCRSLDHMAAVERLESRGIEYNPGEADEKKGYGNSITVDVYAHSTEDDQTLHKSSIRGTVTEGNLMISRINDFDQLYVVPEGNIVCFIYDDRPGVLAEISLGLAEAGINIDDVRNPHSDCGQRSLALLKVNQQVSPIVVESIQKKINASIAFHVEL